MNVQTDLWTLVTILGLACVTAEQSSNFPYGLSWVCNMRQLLRYPQLSSLRSL